MAVYLKMSITQPPRRMFQASSLGGLSSSVCPGIRMIPQHFTSFHVAIFISLSYLLGTALGQKDPVTNFCRRFGHQTAVIDRKLYIDGGMLNWNLQTDPNNYTNAWLSYQDLDIQGSAGMPQLYANLSKNASIPSVSGGVLWGDDINKRFYLFGGEYTPQQRPSDFVLYSYDTLGNRWDSFGAPPQMIHSAAYGAGVSISSTGEGYYYGGWLSNTSVPDWSGPPSATTGLIRYKMDTNEWTNSTGPDNVRRAEGAMVYIPASDGGMLIYFGGVQDMGNGSVAAQPMDKILIYDIFASRWFTQTATGEIPGQRRRLCAGVSWPADQSSYNIYLYGGEGFPPNETGYDDVFVLTLPSFQWIKWYPADNTGNPNGGYPHHSLSCNVVSNAQMLIIGGSFPLDQTCDSPAQFGTHNLDLGKQNDRHVGWNLFQSNLTTYAVPDTIYDVVGGGPEGGARKTAPAVGFEQSDLKVLMTRKASVATRTPTQAIPGATNAPSGSTLSTGAIAGIAVGGGVFLIILLAGCYFFIRRHRRKQGRGRPGPAEPSQYGSGAYTQSGTSSPWSPHTHSSAQTPTLEHPSASYRPPSTAMGTVGGGGGRPVELADERSQLSHLPEVSGISHHHAELKSPSSTASHVHVHVDENGIVWVPQVSPGTAGSSPYDVHPTSRTPHIPAEPQELSPDPRTGGVWHNVEDGTTPTSVAEENNAQTTMHGPMHRTFYHP